MEEITHFYSVWAIPRDPIKERLMNLMQNLRSEYGGPEFVPHVTVVGLSRLTERDAIQKLKSACKGLKPYTVGVNSVSRGGSFYQCLYLLIDPTREVMETSEHCSKHFGYTSSTPYMPHLSLLYGDLTDEMKEKAIENVKSLDESIDELTFEVSSLALYLTDTEDKSLKGWKKVVDWNLGDDKE